MPTFNISAVLTVNTQKSGHVANNPITAIQDAKALQDVEVIIRQDNYTNCDFSHPTIQ